MPEPRLIVFDMDGTLIDSAAMILGAMRAAFAAIDMPAPDRSAILGIVGLSLPVAIARLAPQADAATLERLIAAYKADFQAQRVTETAPLYPGARALLDRLAGEAHTLLAVATGKSRRGLEHILEAHDLRGMFFCTQVADDHPSKPHPSMIEACLRATGAAPARAAMVGDASFDIEMARAAGVTGVGVGWGFQPPARLHAAGAVHVARDFDDLGQWLGRFAGMR